MYIIYKTFDYNFITLFLKYCDLKMLYFRQLSTCEIEICAIHPEAVSLQQS
jgi:hypothetical protein